MGYGYYFLLAFRDFSKNIEEEAEDNDGAGIDYDKSVNEIFTPVIDKLKEKLADILENWETKYKLSAKPYWINAIGKEQHGSASVISCGGADKEIHEVMHEISNAIADMTIDVYHCSWDFKLMEIYSYRCGALCEKTTLNHESIKTHAGVISGKFVFGSTYIDSGDITEYFGVDYPTPFEPRFKFQNK